MFVLKCMVDSARALDLEKIGDCILGRIPAEYKASRPRSTHQSSGQCAGCHLMQPKLEPLAKIAA